MISDRNKAIIGALGAALFIFIGVAARTTPIVSGFFASIADGVRDTITDSRYIDSKSTSISNLAYCASTNPHQKLDLYLPPARSASTPLIIFIHGGGWRVGDKKNNVVTYYSESLLDKGMAVASVNYRLTPEAHYPEQNQDIACALRFLKNNAVRYNYTLTQWGIVGDSAGAQLGAMTLTDSTVNPSIKAFVGLYGPYDLTLQLARNPRPDSDARNYLRGTDPKIASPLYQSHNLQVQYLLFHGQNDRIVSPKQMQRYQQSLHNAGATITAVSVKNAGHSFGSASQPNRETIRAQIAGFFESSLRSQ